MVSKMATPGVQTGAPAADLMIWLAHREAGTQAVCPLTHFDVIDARGKTVGVVTGVWADREEPLPAFLAVRLNWQTTSIRIVPAAGVQIDHDSAAVQVAYTEEQIRHCREYDLEAPTSACA
ncbi:MAG: hypothetical protein PVSMB7_10470 [Chloroflexota bacterium]